METTLQDPMLALLAEPAPSHPAPALRPETAAVPVQEVVAGPVAMALQVLRAGMTPADLHSLLGVHKEWEANEARKAFVADMADFKRNPPAILKDKHVEFRTAKGVTSYDHATIGNVCDKIIKAAAEYGFSHRWIPSIGERGEQVVTCEITHRLGHTQLTTLSGPRDESGNKNLLQGDQSTRSYLERHSVLMAFGFATIDQPDDDGQGAGAAGAGGTDDIVAGWIKYVNSATDAAHLDRIRQEAKLAFKDGSDVAGWNKVKATFLDKAAALNQGSAK